MPRGNVFPRFRSASVCSTLSTTLTFRVAPWRERMVSSLAIFGERWERASGFISSGGGGRSTVMYSGSGQGKAGSASPARKRARRYSKYCTPAQSRDQYTAAQD